MRRDAIWRYRQGCGVEVGVVESHFLGGVGAGVEVEVGKNVRVGVEVGKKISDSDLQLIYIESWNNF